MTYHFLFPVVEPNTLPKRLVIVTLVRDAVSHGLPVEPFGVSDMTRNERRRVAKLRAARFASNKANTAKVIAKADLIKSNLNHPARRESSRGLVMDYSPTRNPLSYTRPMRWTKGAANVGK